MIDYGYGAGELRALAWAVLLVLFGGLIARYKGNPSLHGESGRFGHSELLPGVQLGDGSGIASLPAG